MIEDFHLSGHPRHSVPITVIEPGSSVFLEGSVTHKVTVADVPIKQ